ncbi:PLP-dependent aminotransferase family protein [Entomohabitans teleogrylli]|uniref:MocR-like pyridoxine biosynthesis transcription factor PdxR n=1 Tax=Entomohabitans teleogrylli TaxID=1384589 RepID=UPI00073D997E|nr:PLP-dependent aminotransferase family protein [Entomohabitans teleogrylli]
MNTTEEMLTEFLLREPLGSSGRTLQRELYLRLRQAIVSGRLAAGFQLPGTRTLARVLGISRNTAEAACQQLATEGYLLRDRRGARVVFLPQPAPGAEIQKSVKTYQAKLSLRAQAVASGSRRRQAPLLFSPGVPALNRFPLRRWSNCVENVLKTTGPALLAYGDPCGELALRNAIARHLSLARAIPCQAGQIIVTEGAQQALELSVQLLTNPGECAWLENPGYRGARTAFRQGELQIIPVAVDEEGMCCSPELWQSSPPALIYTSPSHQYPLGGVLSVARRFALLQRARETGAWIIEDDYDSEFRHTGDPVPAMQGLMTEPPVIYCGTFSKTMFPSLRIGYLVLPPQLVEAAMPVLNTLLRGGNRMTQLALAEFIERGYYARHLSAMRRLYRDRQLALRQALRDAIPCRHQIVGGGGGMHLSLVFASRLDDQALALQARRYHMAPAALSDFLHDESHLLSGLVLGYGNTSRSQFTASARRLGQLIAAAQR